MDWERFIIPSTEDGVGKWPFMHIVDRSVNCCKFADG